MFYRLIYALVTPFFRLLYRYKCYGRENIPEGACVVCANHTSSSDPVFLAMTLTRKHHPNFMAKVELLKIPVFGFLLRKLGVFAVKRGQSDMTAIKRALSLLKTGEKVAIFPEGRRVDADEASEARTGAIMLSSRTDSPILPVYITKGRKHLFMRVNGYIGKPYHPGEGKKLNPERYHALADDLMQKIYALADSVPGPRKA